jgi:hypothetical protein
MAKVRYFSDFGGQTVELTSVTSMRNAEFASRFPGVKGYRYDGFEKVVGAVEGSKDLLPVTREITFKSNPSRHECDARCINATGRVMNCECSCGGKNHGRGAFMCTAEAA